MNAALNDYFYVQVQRTVLGGGTLPLPEQNALPGPAPTNRTTLDRYIDLLKKCMDITPSRRPAFIDIAGKLRELAVNEK